MHLIELFVHLIDEIHNFQKKLTKIYSFIDEIHSLFELY